MEEITTELVVTVGLVITLIALICMDGSQELQLMIASGLIWCFNKKPRA